MATYSAMQRLQQGRMALMSHKTWCLYSGLLMMGKFELGAGIPTAGTNGRDCFFGEEFVLQQTPEQLRFLILHENEHKALRQISTYAFILKLYPQYSEASIHKILNCAMDFVVNIRLLDGDNDEGFIALPEGGCYDVKYRGWSTKQVFDDLLKRAESNRKSEGQGGSSSGELDTSGLGGEPIDEHDYEGGEAMSDEEKEQLKEDIDAAIRQGGMLVGKLAGNSSKLLDDVLESQIRWQEILAEFVKSATKGRDNSSWAKINRRWVSSGMYLPSAVSEIIGGLLIGGDASGSTWSGNQLAGFLGEAQAIVADCQPEFVDFVWWDTEVQVVYRFKPEEYGTMVDTIKEIKGGGGTRPSCLTDWVLKQEPLSDYVACIMLSDGLVGNDWGDWDGLGVGGAALPVLWCLNTKGITSPTGQTLHIEDI